MDLDAFRKWFELLGPSDRDYLSGHPSWRAEYRKALDSGRLPKGFVEKTMELLEGGSESET
jgi:hypothetical protein